MCSTITLVITKLPHQLHETKKCWSFLFCQLVKKSCRERKANQPAKKGKNDFLLPYIIKKNASLSMLLH